MFWSFEISDHRILIATALRSQLVTGNAKTKFYRNYNSLDVKLFKAKFDQNLKSNNRVNFSHFQNALTTVLHKHAPIKKKILRFNNSLFMSKALRKAVMHRSKFKNITKKGQIKQIIKNNGIFVSCYFRKLRKDIFKI